MKTKKKVGKGRKAKPPVAETKDDMWLVWIADELSGFWAWGKNGVFAAFTRKAAADYAKELRQHVSHAKVCQASIRIVPIGRCESGCMGKVVAHDNEGVPLCQKCWDELRKPLPARAKGKK